MEFRILGPLEVRSQGRELSLGGAKQRALFAILLLHRNEVVSTDRLIDELWGDRAPVTAAKVVQVYVSQLRKALRGRRGRAEADSILVTRAPGYVLRIEPGELDADRFEQLVDEGRRALAAGNPRLAAHTLLEGLAMWRGPAFADFALESFAQSEIGRLEEARVSALEGRIEADLALGRHSELIGELESLVAAHPLRERLRGQLMLALYRSGRQAEALAAYREARRALVEELGIEPGPALQQLERRILSQDVALASPAPVESEPDRGTGEEAPGTRWPSGTVTFLFTDVEGSTRLVRELGVVRYAEVLGEHHRILREAFGATGGVEVDSSGDAFFVAFATAPAALEAARIAMERLAAGPILVRMGIHTGAPHLTEEGYVGVDVHRAARIAACGHGGQVLVSASTAALAGAYGLRDLGELRLKDLLTADRLYQLGEGEFPPLAGLEPTNLPSPSTPFLGRERELSEVIGLLSRPEVRLLTLTGTGGTGKTRLALQAAANVTGAYRDGVWWVPLAPLRDPGLVLDTAAQALGAKEDLAGDIADRSMLLLLDNFEQVVDAAANLADLLASCPNLDALVTSREALHLTAEHEYSVPTLARDESVDFFVARARALKPDFQAEETVTEICRRLDDLPLALELAAARVKVLPPEQILARLEQRLSLLTGGARDVPERQRTLRATIEWSHQLLRPDEQRLFARLAVFHGGWSLDAAEVIAEADLDVLQSLVDKSLLRHADGRYGMLETLREYAAERCAESAAAGTLRSRHARFFLELAESAELELTGSDQSRWLERLAREHENLRGALEYFLEVGEADLALRLAAALVIFWFVRGHYGEGRAWLDQALADPVPDESSAFAKALWGAGFLGALSNDHEGAPALLERGLAVAGRVGDLSTSARCLCVLGLLAFFRDELTASRALFEESIDAARRAGDTWCLADALGTLGSVCPLQGDLEAADAAGSEALVIARRAGDKQGVRMALFGLALAALRRGESDAVGDLAGEGLAISRDIGDPWFTSYFQWLLASASLDRVDLEAARPAAEEALEIALHAGGALLVVCAREALARVEWAEGNEAAARRQLQDALAAAAAGGVPASYVSAVELTLGRLSAACESREAARVHLDAALALAIGVGDAWAAEHAERALANLGPAT